ncbi:hypothetical protein SAMN05421505_12027 [Sinosporangium album]|uniref:Uncharacterized protein n=1 Tax=Sinosporangium album TaxID=504805 RepID=A0A1G8EBJ8_9ACTN|nr:hypothetical protein [Sinosporangium album]SDH67276.1 hypothetical protein SAMN05421505_12027 [Sinosporangium album]
MATMLAILRPGGRTQRCDARCYTARPDTECDCLCRGVNHGQGVRRAVVNTRRLVEEWVAVSLAKDPQHFRVEIDLEAQTEPLF